MTESLQRYKFIIEYDGVGFVGWQRQINGIAVQQVFEEAIYKFCQVNTEVVAAGRTDSGVHALGQVVHCDLKLGYSPAKLMHSLNHFIRPKPLVITSCEAVNAEFHARFSAKKRYYRYLLIPRPSVLYNKRAWVLPGHLDVEAMQIASNYLIGKHDFTSFRATHCQAASPIKTMDEINFRWQDELIIIELSAQSFLHHMVRNIVGTLALVGLGKWQPEQVQKALLARDRSKAGITAPACGLYFVKVDY